MTSITSPPLRRESLREALPSSIDLLWHRRAGEVPAGYLDDYVALRWLEWDAGRLRLTNDGEKVRREVVDRWALS